MKNISLISSILIFIIGCLHLFLVPYTKVEESFGIQACHDFLFLSKWLSSSPANDPKQQSSKIIWDHENFPGVVHRTFITNFIIAIITKPFYWLFQTIIDLDKFFAQIFIRLSLLFCFTFAFKRFIHSTTTTTSYRHHNSSIWWLTLLTITQFHLIFYSSRTLPNTFALILMLFAYDYWNHQQWSMFIFLFAFTVIVVRFETIILFSIICLIECFYTRRLSLINIFIYGIPSGCFSLLLTILFDSFMWNKWIWPEGDTIWFNIVENKSHLWGVQPFYWYFTNVLPNIFFTTILLLPFALIFKQFWHPYTFVSFAFIFLYSFLPHKELRFIIYVVPLLNAIFAQIIITINDFIVQFQHYVFKLLKQSKFQNYRLLINPISVYFIKHLQHFFHYGLIVNLFLNLIITIIKLYISSYNYPGGYSIQIINGNIQQLQSKSGTSEKFGVYVCDLAAQSGVTRFLQLENVYYNKEPKFYIENFQQYDWIYLLIEPKDRSEYFNQCNDKYDCQISSTVKNDHHDHHYHFNCTLLQSILTLDKSSLTNFHIVLEIHKCQSFIVNDSIELSNNRPSY
uniref:Mannosyltransferase n=1 Tax=Dermatophagoides pteronyssinus TaxID=6956 RepID=A0A6P6Y6F6_DERPT|nr:probable Dol-P-Man:Man(7)GlcNAc(2)-PP-Dol alpha-1,6-mannosyltransferase [Dermatophagoides pteronyssinus]